MIVIDNRFSRSAATECVTEFDRYRNGQLNLQLYTKETAEPWLTASVAVAGEDLPEGCMFVKDYSENQGVVSMLFNAGVIEAEPVKTVRSGFVEISAYRLTEAALAEANRSR